MCIIWKKNNNALACFYFLLFDVFQHNAAASILQITDVPSQLYLNISKNLFLIFLIEGITDFTQNTANVNLEQGLFEI